MRHDEAFERLIEIVGPSPELAEGVDAAVLAHAARCPTCAARIATLTRLDRSLLGAARDHHAVEDPAPALEQRILAIPATRQRVPRQRPRPIRVAATAAIVVLALGIAVPVWVSSRGSERGPEAARTMPLLSRNGSLRGSVTLGSLVGTTRAVRLTADGLLTGKASSYSVWLTGPDGSVLIRSFSANVEGGCDIRADAPDGRWDGIAITMNGGPPVGNAILATAKL